MNAITLHPKRLASALLLAAAATLIFVSLAGQARANKDLDEGLGKLAVSVAKFLKDENRGLAINVGDFIAPPRLQSSGGRGLAESIAQAFKKHGVEVKSDAPMQLIGKFTVREEKENETATFESVALRLRAEVLDAQDEVLQAFNISVFGVESASQIAGLTVNLPPSATPEKKQEEIKDRIEKPQASIVKAETRAAADSPYSVEIYVNSVPRAPTLLDGRSFVPLDNKEEYTIRLHNRSPHDAAVSLLIDGLSMFAFSSEGNFNSQVIVAPGKFVDIPGWYQSKSQTAAFVITSYPDSAAGKKGVTTNIGTITATFSAAWGNDQSPPNDEVGLPRSSEFATGIGRPIEKAYEKVERHIGNARAVISVRYNR